MPNTWSIDIETIGGATPSVKNLRHEEFRRMSEDIRNDRTRPKGERRYIDQRYTDPVKIDAAIQAKLSQGAQLDRATDVLNPLTATLICVVCFPMQQIADEYYSEIPTKFESKFWHGADGIAEFYEWAQQEAQQFLGFNIDQFDIPCLRLHQARTASGIVPRIPAFWNHSIDLRKEFGDVYNKGEVYSTPRSLLYYVATVLDSEAQRPGPVKEYLESDFTGADVAAAYVDWGEGGKDKIIRHCTLDALMPALIAVKMGICR